MTGKSSIVVFRPQYSLNFKLLLTYEQSNSALFYHRTNNIGEVLLAPLVKNEYTGVLYYLNADINATVIRML